MNQILFPDRKFTKGPWAVEPCTHTVWGPAPNDDTRTWGNPICEARSIHCEFGKKITPTEAGANARLIAAAPDLLDGLTLAANRLHRIVVELIADSNSAHYEVSEWVAEARATISKALKTQSECPRCCGNGQTFGPNSGEDIICPDCNGTGRT